MRLLHTSDWHLGRSFHREDLLSAHGAFIDFLLDTVRSERVDAVLVSGDVYDRALPPVDAVSLFNEALARLAAQRVRVVLTSGNHDSATRLGFGSALIDAAGIHLRTDPARCGEPVLLGDDEGPVAVYGLPYLEPAAVRDALCCEGAGHEAVLTAAMTRVRADRARRPGTRAVVMAHAFVAGAAPSESERDISVGGVDRVPAVVFDGVDYTALGHLHGAQDVRPGVRYSGSPLAFSFSETDQVKSVSLVELAAAGASSAVPRVATLPCPVPRPLARVRGHLADLLTGPSWEAVTGHYLQVTLTDARRPREPMERLRTRFPHVLALAFAPEGGPTDAAATHTARLHGRGDLDVACSFVQDVRGSAAGASERALLREAFDTVRRAEALR